MLEKLNNDIFQASKEGNYNREKNYSKKRNSCLFIVR